jgi:trehalose 6-phosphate phosphatase
VACISGRRALEARRIVGLASIVYVGNHGLELLQPGAAEAVTDPAVEPLARGVKAFARGAHGGELEKLGVRLEDKDVIWSFHWRGAPDEEAAREALDRVAGAAQREGLVPHWGRKVLEVRPPVAADKGIAVATVLDDLPVARALYAGDDTTDLDAFRKLRALEAEGPIEALCVGVRSTEGPEDIIGEADLVVDGPDGVTELLEVLA